MCKLRSYDALQRRQAGRPSTRELREGASQNTCGNELQPESAPPKQLAVPKLLQQGRLCRALIGTEGFEAGAAPRAPSITYDFREDFVEAAASSSVVERHR